MAGLSFPSIAIPGNIVPGKLSEPSGGGGGGYFPSRYFAPRYFAPRYWPPTGIIEQIGQIASVVYTFYRKAVQRIFKDG